MANTKNTFWLEIGGGAGVLQDMAQDVVQLSARAITDRANSIYSKITGHSTEAFLPTQVYVGKSPSGGGTPRAWVAVRTNAPEWRAEAVNEALRKAVNAGKVQ